MATSPINGGDTGLGGEAGGVLTGLPVGDLTTGKIMVGFTTHTDAAGQA